MPGHGGKAKGVTPCIGATMRAAKRSEEPNGATRTDPRFDFHCHTFLTDGRNSATDMWHEAEALGHSVLAVTDHVGTNDPKPILERLREEAKGWEGSSLVPLVGVEITHVRPDRIPSAVRAARRAGAEVVLVHGETIAEDVYPGTNRAALETGEVDILAHPGLLSVEEAELAKSNGTVLELSARRGHALTNGHVARLARSVGAELVLDSDAHASEELVPAARARSLVTGAGLEGPDLPAVLEGVPRRLVARLRR